MAPLQGNPHINLIIKRNLIGRHNASFARFSVPVDFQQIPGMLHNPWLRIAGVGGKSGDICNSVYILSKPYFLNRFPFASEHILAEFRLIIYLCSSIPRRVCRSSSLPAQSGQQFLYPGITKRNVCMHLLFHAVLLMKWFHFQYSENGERISFCRWPDTIHNQSLPSPFIFFIPGILFLLLLDCIQRYSDAIQKHCQRQIPF